MKAKYLKELNTKGFTIFRNLISKSEIKLIYSQLESMIDTSIDNNKASIKKKSTFDKKYLKLKKTNPNLKSHFYDMMPYLDCVNTIVSSKKILNIVKFLLKSKTVLINSQRIRLDHKGDQNHLPLHQELNNISNDFILLWVPLVDVNKKTGTLCLVPGSHKYGHLIYKDSTKAAEYHRVGIINKIMKGKEKVDYQNSIVKKFFNKKNIYHANLKAGDAIFFTTYLFHGSTPHVAKKIRWTLLSSFHRVDKTPYLKNGKNTLRIPYNVDYNKL